MDESRQVLQPPAEVSDSGQISQLEGLLEASSKHFDLVRARELMLELVLPARDLAESRFNRPTGHKGRRGADRAYQLCCVDCYTFQSDPVKLLDHNPGCPTGRVLRLIL